MRHDLFAAMLGTAVLLTAPAHAQSATTFTYQGHLTDAGSPADGLYEFEVKLLDNLAVQIGFTETPIATVTDGTFTMELDFGPAAFDGSQRFIELSVRSVMDGGAFTTLSPNQPITSTPVAQFALEGNEGPVGPQGNPGADGLDGAPGSQGPQGEQGPQGDPGNDGAHGADGNDGAQGPQGDQGIPGTPGDSHWLLNGANTYFNAGKVGIGTSEPVYSFEVISDLNSAVWASTTGQAGVYGESTAASNIAFGGRFLASSTEGRGVYGLATSSTGTNYGVFGRTFSPDGYAGYFQGGKNYFEGKVGIGTDSPDYPLHVVSSNTTRSITGTTFFSQGVGIFGLAVDSSGSNTGVAGRSMSTSGTGVLGAADGFSGTNYGVRGETSSPDGYAGYFEGGRNYFSGNVGIEVLDPQYPLEINADGERGISILSSGHYGIFAETTSSSGSDFGGRYQSRSENGGGILAYATHGSGVNYGIYAQNDSVNGFGGYFIGAKSFFEGKVGVGTESPTDKLHISVPAATDALRVQSDGITRLRVNANGGVSLGANSTIIGAGDVYIANNLGIGTNAPTFDLSVSGTAAKTGGGSWAVFSDQRLKKNITSMSGSLDTIDALRPVNFEYKNDEHFSYLPGVQRGFIAQEVRGVIPQWVHQADDGYLYLDQTGYEALLVDAVQELRAEKDAQIQQLKSENDKLQSRVDRLEDILLRLAY